MAVAAVRERIEAYGSARARTEPNQPTADRLSSLNEATLSVLWSGQRFPASALVTRAGVPLRVLHPGRAGRGAGPDFRDAIIAPPSGAALRGDVELHVRVSDFRAHGHAMDPAYNSVVLHVVFDDDCGEDTQLANGRRVAVVALGPWVQRRAQELQQWLSAPRLWREPCHDAVARLGPEAVLAQLDVWGGERFLQRASALQVQIQTLGPGRALFSALIECLGYGGNRSLMQQIAARLDWDALHTEIAGHGQAQQIEQLLLGRVQPLVEGHTGRPANHPARRLAGLAALIARHRTLFVSAPDISRLLCLPPRDLVAAFTAAPLIGRSRAIEILTNAVLPWAASVARSHQQPDSEAVAFARYAELPRPARYGMLSFLEQNLRVDDKPLAMTARSQQGLLALYKSECTQGGCGRCAFSS